MKSWQLQDAKARLSELVRTAKCGPQAITVHGKKVVVILTKESYDKLMGKQPSFVDFMRHSPLAGVELDIERHRGSARDVEL